MPNVLDVRLLWWPLDRTHGNVVWGDKAPHCREGTFEILGMATRRSTRFFAHAISPKEPIPPMNSGAKKQLVRALKDAVDKQVGFPVEGITNKIIDWEYVRNEDDQQR